MGYAYMPKKFSVELGAACTHRTKIREQILLHGMHGRLSFKLCKIYAIIAIVTA